MGLPLQVSAKKAAIPAGSVPTEAPDEPVRAGRSLAGRLSGLAAQYDASVFSLASYGPLASTRNLITHKVRLCVQIAAVRSSFDTFAASTAAQPSGATSRGAPIEQHLSVLPWRRNL